MRSFAVLGYDVATVRPDQKGREGMMLKCQGCVRIKGHLLI
jgi:hypothetical protein